MLSGLVKVRPFVLCFAMPLTTYLGGQFLRAYAERFNDPPMRNLVTFGSQHMGISDIPPCATFDFLCQLARRLVKGEVYSDWAQKNSVQVSNFAY